MKTYLVTGGAGFIGSNFVVHVLRERCDVRVVNADALTYAGNLENLRAVEDDGRYVFRRIDICDAPAIAALFAEFDFDYVVNFAAETHVDRSIVTPEVFVATNVMGTVALLDAARAAWMRPDGSFGNQRFLQVSTDEVYGALALDRPSELFREDTPLSPRSPYSASKASADHFALAYAETYGLPVSITRCSNNYGPFQFPEKLIPLMIRNALAHEPLPVYGDGLYVRDWLYVEDHCRAIDMVLEGGSPGEVYNVGGSNERANIDVVRRIIAEVSSAVDDPTINEGLIRHVTDRLGHDRRYGIDASKIKADLGWYPQTSFEEGIVYTIRWYLDNTEWLDHVASGAYRDYFAAGSLGLGV